MAITTLCTRCGINEVPIPKSIEEDPVCAFCSTRMQGYQFDESCPDDKVREFNNDEGGCPGWNDSCGNTLTEGSDLCPDCTMGRMNYQSPRIGQPRLNYDFGSGGHEYYC